MALTHIVAHGIQRLTPGAEATLALREGGWTTDGRIEECFRELKLGVIKRLSKDYGRFSDDHGQHPLSSWLQQYSEQKISFDSLTQKAMAHFRSVLDPVEVLLDGFVFFAHETLEHDELLHIFFVQHNTGQFIDGSGDINQSFYLDTANISLAAKINLTDWQSGDHHRAANALTLVRWRGEKELTDAFIHFIGFAEKVDVGADTEAFLDLVSDYTKDLPEEAAHSTKKQVVDYCLERGKAGAPVVIAELSQQLSPPVAEPINDSKEGPSESQPSKPVSKPEFARFVSEQSPQAKPELITDPARLRQFVRISGRDNHLSMSFASSCLGDTIVYDPASDSLTINNIPKSLKQRLNKHLQGG